MRFSLVHPSRGRATRAEEALREWASKASGAHPCEHILSIDADDPQASAYRALAERYGATLVVRANRSMVQATNNGAAAATGDVLVVISDDFGCPESWDTALASVLDGRPDAAVLVNDGLGARIMTLPILTRAYYQRAGYVYHPAYLSMYADDDLTETARRAGVLIDARHLHFPHRHYSGGHGPEDETYRRQNSNHAWWHGWRVFQKRQLESFGSVRPGWRVRAAQARVDANYWLRIGGAALRRQWIRWLPKRVRAVESSARNAVVGLIGRLLPGRRRTGTSPHP